MNDIVRFETNQRMSRVVKAAGLVFVGGQTSNDRTLDVKGQTQQVLAKIDALLSEAGSSRSKLLAVNIFLPAICDFDAMNEVYDAWIAEASPPPARACVEARLADPNLRVEITAVAAA